MLPRQPPRRVRRCLQALIAFSSRPSWIAPHTNNPSIAATTITVEAITMMIAARSEATSIINSVLGMCAEARDDCYGASLPSADPRR